MGIAISALLLLASTAQSQAQGSEFTYQGFLNDGASPANGNYDLYFSFHATEGSADLIYFNFRNDVPVVNGLFTVELDLGLNDFTGAERWMEIQVRPSIGGGGNYTELSPRQKLTSAPYANLAGGLPNVTVQGGNVGIGTAGPPSSLLHVNGEAKANRFTVDGANVLSSIHGGFAGAQTTLFAEFTGKGGLGPQIRFSEVGGSFTDIGQDGSGNFVIENSSDTAIITAMQGGNVGIGTTNPTKGKLEVNGSVLAGYDGFHYLEDYSTAPNAASAGKVTNIKVEQTSIYASHRIGAAAFLSFSDRRIKKIGRVSEGGSDLETLLRVEITDYVYKDIIGMGNLPQKKVIAQQVEAVYPQAVSKATDVIPDIYQSAPLSDGWIELATDLKVGDRVKLITEKEEGIHEVLEIRDGGFRTALKPEGDKVFVFGREVDDFRSVDYEAIAMLNVSATQEIYKQLQAEQAKNSDLEKRLTALEARDKERDAKFARLERLLDSTEEVSPVSTLIVEGGVE